MFRTFDKIDGATHYNTAVDLYMSALPGLKVLDDLIKTTEERAAREEPEYAAIMKATDELIHTSQMTRNCYGMDYKRMGKIEQDDVDDPVKFEEMLVRAEDDFKQWLVTQRERAAFMTRLREMGDAAQRCKHDVHDVLRTLKAAHDNAMQDVSNLESRVKGEYHEFTGRYLDTWSG